MLMEIKIKSQSKLKKTKMNKLITFLSDFKYFKKYLLDEINKKTSERLLGKKLNEFVVKTNILNSKPNPKLLEEYKNIIEKNL